MWEACEYFDRGIIHTMCPTTQRHTGRFSGSVSVLLLDHNTLHIHLTYFPLANDWPQSWFADGPVSCEYRGWTGFWVHRGAMVNSNGCLDSCTRSCHPSLNAPEQIQAQIAVADSKPEEWLQRKNDLHLLVMWVPRPGWTFRFTKTKKTSCGIVYIVHLQDFWLSVHILQWFILWGFVIYFPEFISFPMGPGGTHPILH